MEPTDVAAWWGALVATLVLVWDVIKWARRGARVSLRVQTNMQLLGGYPKDENTYISVRATNSGDASTTIENMGFIYYKNWWHRVFHRPEQQFVVSNPGDGFPLPHTLPAGAIWDGRAIQDSKIEDLAASGILMCWLSFSHLKRPKCRPVKFRKARKVE